MTAALTAFSSDRTITITLASLASDANLVAGRESAVINSTSILVIDYHVGGVVVVSSLGGTASRQIEVWSYGTWNAGTNYSGGATGSDASLTLTNTKSLLKLLTIIPTAATSSQAYAWGPFSIAQTYGGVIPSAWGLFLVHNTGANLNATGNSAGYTPIYITST